MVKKRPPFLEEILTSSSTHHLAEQNCAYHGIEIVGHVNDKENPELYATVNELYRRANGLVSPHHLHMPNVFIIRSGMYPLAWESNFNSILITQEVLEKVSPKALEGAIAHEFGEMIHFEVGKDSSAQLPEHLAHLKKDDFADAVAVLLTDKETVVATLSEIGEICKLSLGRLDKLGMTQPIDSLARRAFGYKTDRRRIEQVNALPDAKQSRDR